VLVGVGPGVGVAGGGVVGVVVGVAGTGVKVDVGSVVGTGVEAAVVGVSGWASMTPCTLITATSSNTTGTRLQMRQRWCIDSLLLSLGIQHGNAKGIDANACIIPEVATDDNLFRHVRWEE